LVVGKGRNDRDSFDTCSVIPLSEEEIRRQFEWKVTKDILCCLRVLKILYAISGAETRGSYTFRASRICVSYFESPALLRHVMRFEERASRGRWADSTLNIDANATTPDCERASWGNFISADAQPSQFLSLKRNPADKAIRLDHAHASHEGNKHDGIRALQN